MTMLPYPVFTCENWPEKWPEALDGAVLILDKPMGWSSFRMVGLLRKLLNIRKVGHAGTLDPLATGLLIVAVGRATKLIDGFMTDDKRYEAHIRFGYSTPSYDSESEPDAHAPWDHITRERLESVVAERFTGWVEQTPPIFSAIKIGGVPAYKRARAGKDVQLASRLVNLRSIHVRSFALPDIVLDVTCGKGTYIRSLTHDIGLELGSRATLTGLVRTESGPWLLSSAIPLRQLLSSLDPHGKTGLSR